MPHLDPKRLVFIDETWIKTNMAPIRGWGPKGERLYGFAADGRWQTLTFLATLRVGALTEPCVIDRPDQRTFVPCLCCTVPGANTETRRYRHHG